MLRTKQKTENERMLPEDKNLPLEDLFDSNTILSMVNTMFSNPEAEEYTGIKIKHVRFSPKKSCQLSIQVDSGNKNDSDTYYIRCMNDEIYSRVKSELSEKLSHDNIALVDDSNILICKFPTDGKLNLTPLVWNKRNNSYEIIRYKPETRFVAKYKLLSYNSHHYENVIARIELPEKVQNSYMNTLKVLEAIKGHKTLFVPAVLHFSKDDSLLIQEEVDAVSFAEMLHDGNLAELHLFAETLSELHALKINNLEHKDTSSFVNQFEKIIKNYLLR